MRGIVLIGVILSLILWAASTVELPADASVTSVAHQQETQWRRTALGWLPREMWERESPQYEASLDPVTLAVFESIFAVFAMMVFTQNRPEAV